VRDNLETVASSIDRALAALNEAEDYAKAFPEHIPPGTHGTLERIAGLLLDAKMAVQLLERKC
jgi:hypothetical protein